MMSPAAEAQWPRTARALLSLGLVLLGCTLPQYLGAADAAPMPRREDRGDLIVLYLYGSYYDMGRQQVELLGPVARRVYEHQRARYDQAIGSAATELKLFNLGMDLVARLGPLYEESGMFEELHGMADGLGVSRGDLLRAVSAASFGSTVFAATRSATADGGAIIGRNVDWWDGGGTLRPVVMLFHPNNGDLAYIIAGWPLIAAPAIGINAAGFALSFNFFITDETLGVPPQMRDRRALQTARTVEEGLQVFTNVWKRATPTFMVMADAGGTIAMIECTPSACAVFHPDGDWFAQANHARTAAMIPVDRYRSPDSFRRRAAMEAAVQPHLGTITPETAAQIIRDRSNSPYVNDDTVANLDVLNAAVLQPASKTLWHSTTMQPEAPFGEMVPFSVATDTSATSPLPADPRLGTPAMQHESAVVAEARRAVGAYERGDLAVAGTIWDTFAANHDPLLEPSRLAWGRAVVRFRQNQAAAADALLASIDSAHAPFEVAGSGLILRAVIADRSGQRSQSLALYQQAQVLLDAHPEYTDTYTRELRAWAAAGLAAPQTATRLPPLPDLQRVPH